MPLPVLLLLSCCLHAGAQAAPAAPGQWPTYGGDSGGQRYSAAAQINRSNVHDLKLAWTFHTGAVKGPRKLTDSGSFEATPILFHDTLYFSSPFDQVFALDPASGIRKWSYDPNPGLDWSRDLGIITSRGVASWTSGGKLAGACADRIFLGTLDARLIALDAATGQVCTGFGQNGTIDLTQGVNYRKGDDYAVTSPPTVVGNVVVVGAGIQDNLRVDVERGDVRGFDALTGKLLWTWEPMPWANHQALRTGAGNTWGAIAADQEHHMVYLPTSSPSPDYYGGLRPGDNRDADSIVALDADTGKKVWAYQVVHHNLWDYDIAAEPLLFTFRGHVPAVAATTKMGMVFVFNRLTGEPLYPIHERAVPQSDVPGETTSPTQPFPDLPSLSPLTLDLSMPLGLTPEDDAICRNLMKGLRYEGIYTPPSLQGTILFPSNVGGVNWGSAAMDPATGVLYANTNRWPFMVRLQKRPYFSGKTIAIAIGIVCLLLSAPLLWALWKKWRWTGLVLAGGLLGGLSIAAYMSRAAIKKDFSHYNWLDTNGIFAAHFGKELGENQGTPYVLLRQPLNSPHKDMDCGPRPWGTVSALNLNTGQTAWQTPLGTVASGLRTGTANIGGPIVTAGGLVFTAASKEPLLRAFDAATGDEIWQGRMPVPAQSTPMSYLYKGRQYIVIADGGKPDFSDARSDNLLAFALP